MGTTDFYFYFFAILAILLLIVAPVQWVMNSYFGMQGGVFASVGLSLLGALICQFIYQWGRGMGSVTGNVHIANSELLLIFGSAFLISLALTALSNFGVYHLVQYYKTGVLNKLAFFSWLVIAFGGPLFYIGTKELSSWWAISNHKRHFTPVSLSIYSYPELPITINELKFINSTTGREFVIPLSQHDKFDWKKEEDNNRRLWEVFRHKIDIPKGADKFTMSWYSLVEDTYYSDEFPFPYSRFSMLKFPAGNNEMEPLALHIKPEGKVDLFGSYRKLLFFFFDVATKPISEKEKKEKLALFRTLNMPDGTNDDIESMLHEIKTSGRHQKRMEMEEAIFNWQMTLDGPGKISTIWLEDFRYRDYRPNHEWLNTMSKKPLPAEISVYFQINEQEDEGFWLKFSPDVEKLYHNVLNLTSGNEDRPLEFSLTVKDHIKSEIEFLIKTDEQAVEFTDWQVKIDKR